MVKAVTPDKPFVSTYETSDACVYSTESTSAWMALFTLACDAPYAVKVIYAELLPSAGTPETVSVATMSLATKPRDALLAR